MSHKVKKPSHTEREKQLMKKLGRLSRELEDTQKGALELSRALDGIVAQVIVHCGNKTEHGFEVRIPPVRLDGERYVIMTRRDEDGYVIAAVRAESGESTESGESGGAAGGSASGSFSAAEDS
ncbi:MAG: hypothetical protein IJE90_05505 [Clostridia bacterium]|nr:hypothetical protein [Clostridia bacterium]